MYKTKLLFVKYRTFNQFIYEVNTTKFKYIKHCKLSKENLKEIKEKKKEIQLHRLEFYISDYL